MTEEEMEDEVYGLNCAIGALRSENAKLRELVRGLEVCADEDADARTDCPLYDEGEPDRCAKERIKRELGIEVEG